MRTFIPIAALLALAACQSAGNLDEGERLYWRCDAGKEFNLRSVAGAIEVYASGETHRLDPAAGDGDERRYSNSNVTYVEAGRRATLSGAYNGPFENCRPKRSDWWFDFW